MAPGTVLNPSGFSVSSYLDASNPKLSLRQYYESNQSSLSTAGVFAVAFAVIAALITFCCCLCGLCKKQRPIVQATVPAPIPIDLVDPILPPPPYLAPRPRYNADRELEMNDLARPTAAAVGALGKTGSHGVPLSDVPSNAMRTAHSEEV